MLSQVTTVINYNTANLNTSVCNLFNITPQVSVGGLLHWPVSGGATFGTITGSSTNYLQLLAKYGTTPSSNLGTAYAISYPFAANYTYTVEANVTKGLNTDNVSFPNISIGLLPALLNLNLTDPTDCGAVGQNWWSALSGMFKGFFLIIKHLQAEYPVLLRQTG